MEIPPFYPILDTGLLEKIGLSPIAAVEAVLSAGARILQLRHKGHFTRARFDEAERIALLCSDAAALFVLNDRADIAAMLGAALHLGQEDLPPGVARRVLGNSARIGFSTHNQQQLRAAAFEPVDYLAIGPVFRTASKENPDPVVGVAELRRLRPFTQLPLVAIGGITRENASAVLAAGADSIAVISDLMPNIREKAEDWLRITTNFLPRPMAGSP